MSRRIKPIVSTNRLLASNTSGVPCIALRNRRGRLEVQVTWYERQRLRSTTVPVASAPVSAVERAMKIRSQAAGVIFDITPRQAWARLKKAHEARQ